MPPTMAQPTAPKCDICNSTSHLTVNHPKGKKP